MGSRAEKSALFDSIALMGKAFASPVRLELLDLLAQTPRTVDELARASDQSTANTSQHVLALWLALRDASIARLGDVERAARDYLGEEVDAVGRDELIARLRKGDVVLVDVRPVEEFEARHIKGARSIPIDELEERLAELPADREVVAYCRGPLCAYAHDAVRQLQAAGVRARRLEDGWPEWPLAEKSNKRRRAA